MSDMRRAARALVETRLERFESRHPLDESRRRLDESLARLRPWRGVVFTRRWDTLEGKPLLVAEFSATRRVQRALKGLSIGMALLVAASAWAVLAPDVSGTTRFLLPLTAILAILGFPFLVLGLASARQADEARIAKAIRIALLDEDAGFPPPRRWSDED